MADRVRMVLRGIGQTFITVGVVVLLFAVYELQVTGLYTGREQDALADELASSWEDTAPRAGATVPTGVPTPAPSTPPVDVPLGEGWAVIRMPTLERDYAKVVVQGVSNADLRRGPGHWPRTAEAGEVGNVVVSGHRTTYGAPFNEVDELADGDPIVLETRDAWFTYRVTEQKIVLPSAIDETYPVPTKKGAKPTKAVLTLTTCHPEYSARQRLIVRAVLAEKLLKTTGRTPDALSEVAG